MYICGCLTVCECIYDAGKYPFEAVNCSYSLSPSLFLLSPWLMCFSGLFSFDCFFSLFSCCVFTAAFSLFFLVFCSSVASRLNWHLSVDAPQYRMSFISNQFCGSFYCHCNLNMPCESWTTNILLYHLQREKKESKKPMRNTFIKNKLDTNNILFEMCNFCVKLQ